MKHIVNKLNNISMTRKLLLSYMLLVFIPVIAVGLILTGNMRSMALQKSVDEAVVNVERLEKSIGNVIKVPTDFSNILYTDKTLERVVGTQYTTILSVVEAYREYTKFDDYLRLYSFIDGIMFYAQNETLIENWRFMRATDKVLQSAWYGQTVEQRGLITWRYTYNEAKNKHTFSMTRMLGSYRKPLGVLVVDLSDVYLNSILYKEPFETIVIDDQGYIVAAKDSKSVGRNVTNMDIPGQIMTDDQGTYQAPFDGKLSKLILKSFQPEGSMSKLRILCAFPIDSITMEADRTNRLGITIIVASLFVSLLFITVLSNLLSKRIRRLSGDVHKVAQGNFDFSPAIRGADEVGTLSGDITQMALSIKKLMSEVTEANRQKDQLAIKQREIKLKMLASQINPHFLFNALESIRMRIIGCGDGEVADTVARLGKIMRRNLEINKELTTLSEEIDIVRSYLDIQRFRYGSKIEYEIDIAAELQNYRIMPLLLQPVVENAVVHGLEAVKGGGVIRVQAWRDGEYVRISVSDNGIGMSPERLNALAESLDVVDNESGNGHIGLKNVHQRIALGFGEGYGLKIKSGKDAGTVVDYFLPGAAE